MKKEVPHVSGTLDHKLACQQLNGALNYYLSRGFVVTKNIIYVPISKRQVFTYLNKPFAEVLLLGGEKQPKFQVSLMGKS